MDPAGAQESSEESNPLLLVNPVVLSLLPALHLALAEPERNLLLGAVDGVGAVADVAADVLRSIGDQHVYRVRDGIELAR